MAGNPWLVDSLQTFWQLKCPECPFDSKEEDIFKYHAVTKHPLSLALFAKEFDYSVTVNNQCLGSIKSEISQEKQFDNSLIGINNGSEQGSEDRNVYFDNEIENDKIIDNNENEDSSETLASTLHKELMTKEEFSELNEDLENDEISTIENSEFYDGVKCNDANNQIPEVGINFTTTKYNKMIVFHHNEGYNYNRSRISKNGNCVFLRLVISFLKIFINLYDIS